MATSLTKKGLVACSDKVILAARPVVETIKLFTTDFSVDSGKKGQTINVKVLSATASDFAKSSQNFAKGTNTIKYADIALTNHKISSYQLDDLDVLEDELNPVYAQFAPTSGRALAKAIIGTVTGLFTYGNAAAQKTVTKATLGDFAAWRAAVEAENLDPADCVLLLEPATYAALISVLPASVVGNGGVVNSAIVGSLLGFKAVLEAPNVSKTSADGVTKGIGFVVPTGAVGIAGRYFAPIAGAQGETIEAGYVVDDETGIVFGSRVVLNSADGECTWSADALYGAALMKQTISGASNGAPGYLQLITA